MTQFRVVKKNGKKRTIPIRNGSRKLERELTPKEIEDLTGVGIRHPGSLTSLGYHINDPEARKTAGLQQAQPEGEDCTGYKVRIGGELMEFRTKKDGTVYPIRRRFEGITRALSAADLKKIHLHGLSLAGYALDLADDVRKRALEKAIKKYGKADTMAELSLLRIKYEGNARMERVIDSDIAYVAAGKFGEV
ncbi:hypothetical protein ApAK_08645 [Thermoplasmatales archaeon AK]|nr:hypothetical protein [Thermoplasmatales archaeon AK]